MDVQKFIRTFEGDKETLKKGGTPDLAPLDTPVPPPLSTPPPQPITIPEPLPIVAPEVPPPPAEVLAPEDTVVPLKTYAGDFSERMKETHASTATVLAAEQDNAQFISEPEPKSYTRSNLIYGIGGGILLIAGVVGAYIAYTKYLGATAPVVVAPTITAPIFVDEREQVSGTGAALLKVIQQSVAHPIGQGAVRFLYFETPDAATPSPSVFSALNLQAPGPLTRNIQAAKSMAGVIYVNGTQSPFFILSVSSYGDTFAGMLRWESLMPRDLAALFPPYPAPIAAAPVATSTASTTIKTASKPVATGVVSTSTPQATTPVPTATFLDAVVANHDVRVYRDSAGRDVLLYGYWNQATLIIARDAGAFAEVVKRLATSRTSQS